MDLAKCSPQPACGDTCVCAVVLLCLYAGIVMALYALLRSKPDSSAEEIEAGLDGNLCRCTGELDIEESC